MALFDDPFADVLDPWKQLGRRPTSPIQPFQPAEAQSVLGKLANTGMGGLAYLGSSLDKAFGARALRGLIGGRPEELASIIPFSDTLGITDESNRVSGEDLLKKAGVLEGEGEKGTFELRDLLGPALEIGLDPATYATFGTSTLGRGGQIAKAIGKTPATAAERLGTLGEVLGKEGGLAGELGQRAAQYAGGRGWNLAEHLDQPMGGLMGLGLPFSEPSATFGGPKALAALLGAGKTIRGLPGIRQLDQWSEPLRRGLATAFDPRVLGTFQPESQAAAREVSLGRPAGQAAVRGQIEQVGKTLGPEGLGSGQELRYATEQPGAFQPTVHQVGEAVPQVEKILSDQLKRSSEWRDVKSLENYFPRQAAALPGEEYTKGFKPKAPLTVREAGREDILKGIPGESQTIDRWMREMAPQLAEGAMDKEQATNQILRELGSSDAEVGAIADRYDTLQKAVAADPMNQELAEELQTTEQLHKSAQWKQEQAGRLADWLGSQSPGRLENVAQTGSYWGQPIADLERKLMRAVDGDAIGEAANKVAAKVAGPQRAADDVKLTKFLEDVGIKDRDLRSVENSSVLAKQAELMGLTGESKAINKTLNGLYVPRRIYDDWLRFSKPYESPEFMKPFLKAFDSVTNLTKTFQIAFWPAKYVRDFFTGQYQNFVHGAFDLPSLQDAMKLHFGQPIQDGEKIQSLLFQHNLGSSGGLGRQVIGQGDAAEQFANRFAGRRPMIPENLSWDPRNIAGFAGRRETTFAPAAVGYNIGNKVFDINETAAFIKKLRDGFSPEAAAKVAKDAQFHWGPGSLTNFEQSVMRRVMPFYSWARQNIPSQVKQLIEHPGGVVAQSVRAESDFKQKQGFLPEYLESSPAIPVGKEEGGTQRFLTATGLPYQDLGELVGKGPNRLTDVGMGLLGQTNPLIKAPLEEATGKQFFTGRDLADLYSRTGLPQPIEQLLMNSPAGRFVTTASTLADERKGLGAKALNLLSGVKLSDVDMEKQRNIEAQNLLDELLRGKPSVGNIQRFYAKPGAELSKDEMELLRLQATLEKSFRERKKAG